jgi:Dolichyl-phosphate-mannose-protein mannosyltransferase
VTDDPTAPVASRPAWRAPARDYAVVAGVAVLVRLVALVVIPGMLSSPDTNKYVIMLGNGSDPTRPSLIPQIWLVGSLGTFHESTVAAFQIVAGILASVALFDGLRCVVRRWVALAAALVFAAFPLVVAFERIFLQEAVSVDLGVVVIWAMCRAVRTTRRRAPAAWLLAGALAMALMVLERPVLQLAGVLVLAVLLWLAWGTSAGGGRRIAVRLVAPAVVLAMFVVPLGTQAWRNHRQWGTTSLSPDSGLFLAARWAPIMPCQGPAWATPEARAWTAKLCQEPGFGAPPGKVVDLLWTPEFRPMRRLATLEERQTNRDLARMARSAMLHHPRMVVSQVSRSVLDQLFGAPAEATFQLRPGFVTQDVNQKVLTGSARTFFGGRVIYTVDPNSPTVFQKPIALRSFVRATDRTAQFLLWVVMALGIAQLVGLVLVRRRRIAPTHDAGRHGVALGLAAAGFIGASILTTALGGYDVFRYQIPLVPWALLLGALWLEGALACRRALAEHARPPAPAAG